MDYLNLIYIRSLKIIFILVSNKLNKYTDIVIKIITHVILIIVFIIHYTEYSLYQKYFINK